MRRLKFVTLALSGSALLSAGAAHAQFGGIVHDPTAFARQLQELNEARKVVQQSAQQLDEARALYRDLNKMTDIGNVANQLKNDVLRTSNVSSSSLDGYTSGDLNVVGGLRGKANDVYQDLLGRSEEHTSELQSLMRNSYAVFCLKKKTITSKVSNTIRFSTTYTTHHTHW